MFRNVTHMLQARAHQRSCPRWTRKKLDALHSESRIRLRIPRLGCFLIKAFVPKNPSKVGFSFSARERGLAGVRPSMPCKRHWPGMAEQAACRLNCRQERDRSQVCRVNRIPQGRVCSIPRKRRQERDRSQVCRVLPSFRIPQVVGLQVYQVCAYRASAAGGEIAERAACRPGRP